jgi:DNA-binding NtrC family response regulator
MISAHKDLKILVIDDEHDICETLKSLLERKGYTVVTAQDGLDGLRAIDEHDIDIVFCDIVMLRLDGLAFLGILRERHLKIEVIVITGYSTMGSYVTSIEQDVCAYLMKPLTVKEIFDSLAIAEKRIKEKYEACHRRD